MIKLHNNDLNIRMLLRNLSFRSRKNHDFEKIRTTIINKGVIIGALLAAFLVPLFGILDYISKIEYFFIFMFIRSTVTVFSIFIYFLVKTSFGRRYSYQLGAVLTFVVSGSISLMCVLSQGPADPYYAGINLPLLGFGLLLPLTIGESSIVFAACWLAYFVPNYLIMERSEWAIFISNNFFMISTIIIAVAGSQFNLFYRRKTWLINRRLQLAHKKLRSHTHALESQIKERTKQLIHSERLAVIGQLSGGIAHDFNNILTTILGTCELALNRVILSDETRDNFNTIYKVGKGAANLVKQLLAFSRKQILQPQLFNLNLIIEDSETMIRTLIEEEIELSINCRARSDCILGDPIQIEQILLNLILNARDAMPHGGKLSISTDNVSLSALSSQAANLSLEPGEYVRMNVTDTGVGMSDKIKKRIFEPFFTTKEKERGTGLGLASVYGILKQINGDVVVNSTIGEGSEFNVYFPLSQASKEEKEEKTINKRLPQGNETILLVEDESAVRNLTAKMLEQQGYKVIQAKEGLSALSIFNENKDKIDLLITDVIMPYLNGVDLVEKVKLERPQMKVLFISGHVDPILKRHNLINEGYPFLQKPYTMKSLGTKVRQVMENEGVY
ncbi:MAG: response regulator [bacterium]